MSSLQPLLNQGSWWKGLIFQLLPLQDALRLSSTCQGLHAVQALKIPFAKIRGFWIGEKNGSSVHWQALSIDESCDIVCISWKWRDQGWGHRKGAFAVVRGDGQLSGDFGPVGEEVVVFRYPAPQAEEQETCRFMVEKDSQGNPYQYHIWLRVGGEDAHSLEIANLHGFGISYLDPEVHPMKHCFQYESLSVVKAPGAPKGFVPYGGVWKVENNVLQCMATGNSHLDPPNLLISDLEPFSDGTVSVEILIPSLSDEETAHAGISFRVAHPATSSRTSNMDFVGYLAVLCPGEQAVEMGTIRRIWEGIGTFPLNISWEEWILLEVCFLGPELTVRVNGSVVANVQDATLQCGRIGLHNWAIGTHYRNLKVKTPSYDQVI